MTSKTDIFHAHGNKVRVVGESSSIDFTSLSDNGHIPTLRGPHSAHMLPCLF